MKDQEFLMWLHERLEHVHREPAQADYMHKLRAIIEATPEDKETPNFGFTQTMDDLRTHLAMKAPNAIELTGSPLAASPATGGSDVE